MERGRYVILLLIFLGGCDPRWIVGTSEVVEEIGSESCVVMALERFDGLSQVTTDSQQRRTLTGKVVDDPNTFRFETEFGPANLWYTLLANGKWELSVAYSGIGISKPPTMTDDAKGLMEELAKHVLSKCFANDA